jgi:hypothetical protein
MFYVYKGFIGPDNYDCSYGPLFTLKEFETEQEVLEDHKEFHEDRGSEDSHVTYRAIEGSDVAIVEKERVTEHALVRGRKTDRT